MGNCNSIVNKIYLKKEKRNTKKKHKTLFLFFPVSIMVVDFCYSVFQITYLLSRIILSGIDSF